ncbi:MAG: AAA family ATPase [Bacteroidales bacterium]|nr:AAA family ATPase [Bacteroidales bacterium]
MINNITIKNYKSVVNVNLPLGRFNLLIGANGCGKSNILEGIALGAAASADKLDYEYFANRGIRVVDPRFMLPAFDDIKADKINISVSSEKENTSLFGIHYNNDSKPPRWEDDSISFSQFITYVSNNTPKDKPYLSMLLKTLEDMKQKKGSDVTINVRLRQTDKGFVLMPPNVELNSFLIYSLEESVLRKADNSNRIYPLGRHGEGLFAYLKELSQKPEGIKIFDEIKENLKVLDWFDDMNVPYRQLSMEFNLKLKDIYLSDTLNMFDQRSTNEGFLYLLFYLTLIISDESPKFFAIENIDTAFNPKLCREVTRRLIELANKHNKQIIATTHNAAVLDGMDIRDDNVRLHVVRRTIDGHTNTNRVMLKDNMKMSLSEAWLKGLIGGLPDNF